MDQGSPDRAGWTLDKARSARSALVRPREHGTLLFTHKPDANRADLIAAAATDARAAIVAQLPISVQELGSHGAGKGDIAQGTQSEPGEKRIEVAGQG